MNNILVFGGEFTFGAMLTSRIFTFAQVDAISTMDVSSYDLVLVEDNFEVDGGRVNGMEVIFNLRLKANCILPIFLVYFEKRPNFGAGKFYEVLHDPYLKVISRKTLRAHIRALEDLIPKFGIIQSREVRRILYQDLKNTIYREGGYISELRHGLITRIGRLPASKMKEAQAIVSQSAKEVDRVLQQWKLHALRRQQFQDRFEACRTIGDMETLKDSLTRIFNEIEPAVHKGNQALGNQALSFGIHILYISDRAENHRQLEAIFAEKQTHSVIQCSFAFGKEDARRIILGNNKITTVLCDYRFWKGQVVGKENGYMILAALKRQFNHLHFAYLTHFNRAQLIIPPGFRSIKAYSKPAVFSGNSDEFFRLLRRIIQKEGQILKGKDKWFSGNGKTSREMESWRTNYAKYFLRIPEGLEEGENFDEGISMSEINEHIGSKAADLIIRFIQKDEDAHLSIPKVGTRLSRVKPANIEQAIWDRLLIRRVVIGLFNYPDLPKDFYSLVKDTVRAEGEMLDRPMRFKIIHLILRGLKQIPWKETAKGASNFFTENLCLYTNVDYRLGNKELQQWITFAELRWLQHLVEEEFINR